MSRGISLVTVALAVVASVGTLSANIVTNGSFEDTTGFVNQGNDTMSPTGSQMPGWNVVGVVAWIGPANPFGISALDGSYFLDLTNYQTFGSPNGVAQDILTPIAGTYQLSFYLGSSNAYGNPTGIKATAGTTTQTFSDNFTDNVQHWTLESFLFSTSTPTTHIELDGSAGVNYIGLDNVSVDLISAATPEPGFYALLGVGLSGLAVLRRKIRRNS